MGSTSNTASGVSASWVNMIEPTCGFSFVPRFHASPETLPGVLARAAKAEHRVERCLQRGKSEAGLAESQV